MNVNTVDLTPEEARVILADGRLILASRAEVEEGQRAIAERDRLRAEVDTAKEELLKCVQWQHELRQQRAVIANQNRIQLTYLLECHRNGGITPLFLALEEYVQGLQGETK